MLLKKINNIKNSLLFRLTLLYSVTFILISAGGYLIFYYRIYDVTMERMDQELLAEIDTYRSLLQHESFDAMLTALKETVEVEEPEEDFYRLFHFDGKQLFTTDMSTWGVVGYQEDLKEVGFNERDHIIRTASLSEQDGSARIITAKIGEEVFLQIGESLEEVEEYLRIFLQLFSILIFGLIILSIVLGWVLARWATSDMKEVIKTAEDISKGAYDRRVQVKGQLKEIERLGDTFNRMLDRIQALIKSMKEINDNIAHDLRSPLTRIRGLAEIHLLQEKSLGDFKDMASSTIEECDMLISMINTMLDITEAEAGVNGLKLEEFDLTTLIQEACELFQPIADGKKITVTTSLPQTLILQSNRKKMQRIITNLLENAIKYTNEKGCVGVSANVDEEFVQIEVADTGIGISKSDLPYIFQRFYRCSRSRSQGGVGLGLSLVKAYTESLNGAIKVESQPNKGSCFSLTFSSVSI